MVLNPRVIYIEAGENLLIGCLEDGFKRRVQAINRAELFLRGQVSLKATWQTVIEVLRSETSIQTLVELHCLLHHDMTCKHATCPAFPS